MAEEKKSALQTYFESHPDPFMKSRDALGVVCQELASGIPGNCDACKVCLPCREILGANNHCPENCPTEEQWKQYFRKKATIPDGWDVIRKESKRLKEEAVIWAGLKKFLTEDKFNSIAEFLENLCKKYGIEVDDE